MKRSKEKHSSPVGAGGQAGRQASSLPTQFYEGKKKNQNTEILMHMENKPLIFVRVHLLQHQNLFSKYIFNNLNQFISLSLRQPARTHKAEAKEP